MAATMRTRIGADLRRARIDASLTIRAVADAAGIDPSHLSMIERGRREASIATLIAVCEVLGLDPSVRLYPRTGPRIHDRLQAPIVEALLREAHPSWKRLVEVPVWRPARGVIDAVLAQPGEVVVAAEIHSQIARLEQQLRWANEKAESLPSAEAWPMVSGGRADVPIGRLLVLRNTRANRDLARTFEETLRATFPGRAADAVRALRDPAVPWPGAALIWADVAAGVARVLDHPPRGLAVGR